MNVVKTRWRHDLLGPFQAFRGILENCLLEEICLELKITLKNVIKNVPGRIFANSKKI